MSPLIPALVPPELIQRAQSPSVSIEANYIDAALGAIVKHLEQPVSSTKAPLFSALSEIYFNCKKPNWDGYESKPLPEDAFRESELFIRQLPHSISLPHMSPSPTGSIIFEWRRGTDSIFMVSLSGNRKIAYAAILGENEKINVTEKFLGEIPQRVEEILVKNFR